MNNKTIWRHASVIMMLTLLHGLPAFGKIMNLDQLLDLDTINDDGNARFPLAELSDELANDVGSRIPVINQIILSDETPSHRRQVILLVAGNALLKESNPADNRQALNIIAEAYVKHPQYAEILFEFLHRAKNEYLPEWFEDDLHYRVSQDPFNQRDIMLLALFYNEKSTSRILKFLDTCKDDKILYVRAALARQTRDHQHLDQITNRFYALTQENWIYDPFGTGKSEELREMIVVLSYIGTAEALYILFDGLMSSRIIYPDHHLPYRKPWDSGVKRFQWLMDRLGESSISSELTCREAREIYIKRVQSWWQENKESIKNILYTNEPLPYYWVRDDRVIWFINHMGE